MARVQQESRLQVIEGVLRTRFIGLASEERIQSAAQRIDAVISERLDQDPRPETDGEKLHRVFKLLDEIEELLDEMVWLHSWSAGLGRLSVIYKSRD